jgi:uncharacterized protein (DUF58 family)
MIYPGRRLHLTVLAAGIPGVIIALSMPHTAVSAVVIAAVLGVCCAGAAGDALTLYFRSRTLRMDGAAVIRGYRAVPCTVPVKLRGRGPVRGMALETGSDAVYLKDPVRFVWRPAEQPLALDLPVIPLTRGETALRSVRISVESPLGFWRRLHDLPIGTTMRIFANSLADTRSLSNARPDLLTGGHVQRAEGKGREVDRLRDYIPGDGMDDIHWKATARHGRPISKEYCLERSQNLYIVIDASRSSRRIVDRLQIDGQETGLPVSLLERSIVAADVLAKIAAKQSDRVGIVAFDDKVRLFLAPGMGSHYLAHIRNSLIGLAAGGAPADYRELFQYCASRIKRRSMIVILADFDDPYLSANFSEHLPVLAKNNVVVGVCPVGEQVKPVFSSPVSSSQELFRSLGGHMAWQSLQQVRRAVRTCGAEVVLASHTTLAVQAIEAYLSLKRRQRV